MQRGRESVLGKYTLKKKHEIDTHKTWSLVVELVVVKGSKQMLGA